MNYDVIIGIETHVQLNTQSKMFCNCSTDSWQAEPNTLTCPVCLGLPGALPVANKEAIDKSILVGLALHSQIATNVQFDRKNYVYPDLSKAYQITQFAFPVANGGYVEVAGRKIELIRAHLEEDVGKLTHLADRSLVNYNKGGTPLLEIVSKPMIHSAQEASQYVQALRQIMRYIGVNEGNLEKGTMRADINISLQPKGGWQYQGDGLEALNQAKLNDRVEIKNLNSFRAIERAVEYEITRQQKLLDQQQPILQETRGWDDAKGVTLSQRSKEEAQDYRYFPEPDIPPLVINQSWIDQIAQQLVELPAQKSLRFQQELQLSEYAANIITTEKSVADWFEAAVAKAEQYDMGTIAAAQSLSKWLLGDVAKLANQFGHEVDQSHLSPQKMLQIIKKVEQKELSLTNAKELAEILWQQDSQVDQVITQRGWALISDDHQLQQAVSQVIEQNQDVVASIKAGKTSAAQFLVGQVMKLTKGQARPDKVKQILQEQLQITLE